MKPTNLRTTFSILTLAGLYLTRFLTLAAAAGEIDFAAAMHLANEALADHGRHFNVAHGIRHQAREMLLGVHRLLQHLRHPD